MDLVRANRNLTRLRELAAGDYGSVAELALAYVKAGCEMFGFRGGAVRGEYSIDWDPDCILNGDAALLNTRALNDNGCLIFAGPQQLDGGDAALLDMMAEDLAREMSRRSALARLLRDARHDQLTRLPGRLYFMELLDAALRRAARESEMVALLFIDLDRFKLVNDTLGHAIGDRVLQQVAARLGSLATRPAEAAARFAGDEFMLVVCGCRDESAAAREGARILEALRAPYSNDGYELFVAPSIGLSIFPRHGHDAAALLHRADLAMYRAKAEGGNKLQIYNSGLHGRAVEAFQLENDLRRAVDRGELELSYQPLVTIDGMLDGMEALLAWNHPKLGRTAPREFIPIAEESGLIVPIGSWVIRDACATGAKWQAAGLRPVRLSVNVSALQFARSDFVDSIAATLASTGFEPQRLELELTETFVLRDIEESARRMKRIRDLGVSIAIDDFGAGYSSLSYLRRLPANSLKIDKSFLRELAGPDESPEVVRSIVLLAHSMGLSVVAEGIESVRELELLRAAGCDKVQGHLYGEPLREPQARALLARADAVMPLASGEASGSDS
jgi:diguanylate cyclase (GGDEF)-like protein